MSRSNIAPVVLLLVAIGCGGDSGSGGDKQLARAWAAGDVVVRSDDGGRTWDVVRAPEGLTSVAFANRSSGWAVGPSTILVTTDGGDSWVDQSDGVDFNVTRANAVSALSASRAVIVGGMIPPSQFVMFGMVDVRLTTNAGSTWSRPRIEFGADPRGGLRGELRRVCFTAAGVGFACGRDFTTFVFDPRCYLSEDSGSNWQEITDRVAGDAVACVAGATLWALRTINGRNELFQSTDDGVTWVARTTLPSDFTGDLDGIAFATELRGWVVGQDAAGLPAILRTTDGGDSWVAQVVPGDAQGMLTDVQFADSDNGIAVGSASNALGTPAAVAYATSDGGEEWVLATFPPDTPELRSITLVP